MNDREFFNSLAEKWDSICHHDFKKIQNIVSLSGVKKNSKILDVGTGTGVLVPYLLESFPQHITAIDVSENMIKVAKKKINDSRVSFIVKDFFQLEVQSFDYIFFYSVYPHFLDKEALFMHAKKLLKKDGKIVIAHSESKEKINSIHRQKEAVKDHMLLSANITAEFMSKYFKVESTIDNDDMYYICASK